MQNTLSHYVPEAAVPRVLELLQHEQLIVKVKKERKTRHGDYKRWPDGTHQITVNGSLNAYRFLITLVHEVAHFEAYQRFGFGIKPHGVEWKRTFQRLMLPFLNPEIFPDALLPLLAQHFKNPKASSDTDINLALALKQFDEPNGKNYIFEIPEGSTFKLYNGKIFQKGKKRVKRYECVELKTKRVYLFNPNAEVELLEL